MNRVAFYWLGSVPCRLFISWVFIDWGTASWESRVPVVIVFILLSLPVILRRSPGVQSFINVLYIAVVVCIITGSLRAAGWALFASTCVSSSVWFMRNDKVFKKVSKPLVVTSTPQQVQVVDITQLRF